MITQHSPTQPEPNPVVVRTAIDSVFETLLADIVRGRYPTGTRLPAERELAKQLGASRPTLREALRRLGEWNLIKARRGSGIAVQDRDSWTIEVLPSFMRYSEPGPESPSTPELLKDMLRLRRSLMIEIMNMVASRVPAESIPKVRQAMHHAWQTRAENPGFVSADLNVLRDLVSTSDFLPGLWMLNQMSGIYLDLAEGLGNVLAPGGSFESAWNQILDALKSQRLGDAAEHLSNYLAEQDQRLLKLLD